MYHIKSKITFMGATALVFAMIIFAFSQNGWATTAEGIKLVEVVTTGTFDQTVDKVKTLVAKNDMMVMGEINQGKMLSMTGIRFNGVTLFIGNPYSWQEALQR